ncbi:MAG: nucleotidyltransferase family protein [Thermoanaerobaculaceae bacterium]
MTDRTSPYAGATPEVAWALALCRRDAAAVPEPGPGFEWGAALLYASRHRLGPTIYWRLRDRGFSGVQADAREVFERSFRATVGTNLAFVRVFLTLLDRLEARGLPVIALKGPVAAYAHHGNLAARQFGDLDLLVPPDHATSALDELRDLGFAPEVPLGQRHLHVLLGTGRRELKLAHSTGWVVDLHWGSLGAHFAWCRDSELWARSAEVDFEGRPVRTLGGVDLALYYCLKAAEDGWSAVYQLLDAARALEALDDAGWDRLHSWAAHSGKWRAVGASVALARELLGVDAPPHVAAQLAARRDIGRLVARATPRLLSADSRPVAFLRVVSDLLCCLELQRDRARLLYTLALQPGERDLALLPAWLAVPPFPQVVRLARTAGNLTAASHRR